MAIPPSTGRGRLTSSHGTPPSLKKMRAKAMATSSAPFWDRGRKAMAQTQPALKRIDSGLPQFDQERRAKHKP